MNPALLRPFGKTGIEVSALSFGCAPIGGLYTPVSEAVAYATLQEAWRVGVRFFDTAPLYGLGVAEERLGRLLTRRPRDEFVVSTKVGRLIRSADDNKAAHDISAWTDTRGFVPVFDFSYDGVMRSIEESLKRLGLDRIDIALIHDPDDHYDQALAEAYPALAKLRDEGVIRAVGAGMNEPEMLTRFVKEADFDCVLVAGRFTLIEQSAADELLPLCEERGIALICGGVFNSGLLADPRPGAMYNYAPAPANLIDRARRMSEVCRRHGLQVKVPAIQYPFTHAAVSTVLVGARSPEEVAENAKAFVHPIPRELWSDLRSAGLLA